MEHIDLSHIDLLELPAIFRNDPKLKPVLDELEEVRKEIDRIKEATRIVNEQMEARRVEGEQQIAELQEKLNGMPVVNAADEARRAPSVLSSIGSYFKRKTAKGGKRAAKKLSRQRYKRSRRKRQRKTQRKRK
jgi:hypothetical protein